LTLGVPISEKFLQEPDPDSPSGGVLKPNAEYILISNGGAGFANNLSLTKYLHDKIGNYSLIVVNGRNEKSKNDIDEFVAQNNITNVVNLGFVTDMHYLMKNSKIMVGKSGSSSVCEASACKLRFIVLNNLLFPEVRNIKFLKNRNAATVVKNKRQILAAIKQYASDDGCSQEKHGNFVKIAQDNVSDAVARKIIEVLNQI
ncbi:MAG: hypothetical protein NC350_03840, partial [Corallococcus sp.]|nr:hypothetical protein [Corallococcus sp.]